MNHIKVREEALSEVIQYLENDIGIPDIFDDNYDDIITIYGLFVEIFRVCHESDGESNDNDQNFKIHVKKNLVLSHDKYYTLPTPVFSYTKPSSGVQF